MPGKPALTSQEKKALKHVLLFGEIPKTHREKLRTGLQKMGFESAIELTSTFFQHALGRVMNDVVGVEAPLSPPRTLRKSIEGLLEQLLIEDEAPIAAIFSQLEEDDEAPSGQAEAKRSSAPRSSPGPKLSEAQLRTLQHALFAPIEANERVQKAGRRSEATLAKLEGLGLLKLIKGQKHHKITAQGERLLVQLGLEAIEDKEPAPAKDVSSSAKKSPSKKPPATKKTSSSRTSTQDNQPRKKASRRTSLGPLFERALERAEAKPPAEGAQSTAAQAKRKSTSKAQSRATTKKRARRSPKRVKVDSPSKDDSSEHEAPDEAQAAEKSGRKTVIRRAGKLLDKAGESVPEAISAPEAPSTSMATADPKAALLEGLERPIRFDEAQSRVGAGYGPVMRELVKAGLYFRHVGHQLWLLTNEGIERAKAVKEGGELVLQEASSADSPAVSAVERPQAPASP